MSFRWLFSILLLIVALPSAWADDPYPGDKLYKQAQKFDFGFGEKVNKTEAVRLYREAAADGNPLAMFRLAEFYHRDLGILKKDEKEADRLYRKAIPNVRKAAEGGSADAQYKLARVYAEGLGGEERNLELAVKWSTKSADQNWAVAQNSLGLRYLRGNGVQMDKEEAMKWFRKAADQNYAEAQRNVGLNYLEGEGVKKNEEEALKWFRKAADQNLIDAQIDVGLAFELGRGVQKDDKEAAKWYRKAVALGSEDAKKRLKEMGLEP
jgi:TPR repeat protein